MEMFLDAGFNNDALNQNSVNEDPGVKSRNLYKNFNSSAEINLLTEESDNEHQIQMSTNYKDDQQPAEI